MNMKVVTVDAARTREARKTRDDLHKLGVPFATEPLPVTVRVTRGDQVQEWDGYRPDLIKKHCGLKAVR